MDPGRDLDAAYRAANYTAETPQGQVVLVIDQPSALLDSLLIASGASSWAYISAHNPGSVVHSADHNEARHGELRAAIARAGHHYFEGAGTGDGWPPEQSFLIFGLSEPDATMLGQQFGQLAILVGRLGEPARLLWLRPDGADGDTPLRL